MHGLFRAFLDTGHSKLAEHIVTPGKQLVVLGQSQRMFQSTSNLAYSLAEGVLAAGDSKRLHTVSHICDDTELATIVRSPTVDVASFALCQAKILPQVKVLDNGRLRFGDFLLLSGFTPVAPGLSFKKVLEADGFRVFDQEVVDEFITLILQVPSQAPQKDLAIPSDKATVGKTTCNRSDLNFWQLHQPELAE